MEQLKRNKIFRLISGCLTLLAVLSLNCLKSPVKLSPGYEFIQLGNALLEQGMYDEADAKFHEALSNDPNSAEAYLGLGRIWLARGVPFRARLHLHKAIQTDKKLYAAYGYLGDIYLLSGDLERALEYYEKCPPEDPHYPEIHFHLGNFYLEQGNLEASRNEFELIESITGSSWQGCLGLGRICHLSGDQTGAEEYLMKAFMIKKEPAILEALGEVLADLHKFEEAYLLLRRFYLSGGPDDNPELISRLEELKDQLLSAELEPECPGNKVEFKLSFNQKIEVAVFDLEGNKIKILFKGYLSKGNYNLQWDGKDEAGQAAPAGLYLANIEGESFIDTRKLSNL
ncbi:tetratricopeptide repeat protein [bacterium]|nr:tetratricopeptide repeat protein [bacterium]